MGNPIHHLPTKVEVVDTRTGKVTETRQQSMMIMPAPEGTCPLCAQAHNEAEPHDALSLRYQYAFYGEHGRWPTWADALAHCSEELRAAWTAGLADRGVDVAAGQLMPKKS